jgi:hypothetical protein
VESVKVFNLADSNFSACAVSKDNAQGGALACQLTENLDWICSGCTFSSCFAPDAIGSTGKGGAIFLDIRDLHPNYIISTPSFSTENETRNRAAFGRNIFVESVNLHETITLASFPFYTRDVEALASRAMEGHDSFMDSSISAYPLAVYLESFNNIYYVAATGVNVPICGFSFYQCRTLDYAFFVQNLNDRRVYIDGFYPVDAIVTLNMITFLITGELMASVLSFPASLPAATGAIISSVPTEITNITFRIPPVFTNLAALFSVTGSTLSIHNCNFQPTTPQASFQYSWFVLSAGLLVLPDIALSDISFAAVPLLHVSTAVASAELTNASFTGVSVSGYAGLFAVSGTLTVDGCSFSSTTFENSALFAPANEKKLQISNSNFTEIHRNAANGSALCSPSSTTFPQLSIIGSNFTHCSATADIGGGGSIASWLDHSFSWSVTRCWIVDSTAAEAPHDGRGGGILLFLGDDLHSTFMLE